MKKIHIDTDRIRDWDSFHDLFQELFGFPDFYGRNMDAWIDCMTSLDTPEDGMTSIHVNPGEVLVLDLSDPKGLKQRCPEIYDAIVECSAFVNYRQIDTVQPAIIALSFNA